MMRILLFAIFVFLFSAPLFAQQVAQSLPESKPESVAATEAINHYVLSDILEKYANKNSGLVDYRMFKRDKESIQKLDAYVADMMKIDGFALEPIQERKAYWLNLYNSLILKEIIHRYPINMTAEINHFFDDKRYEIAAFKGEKVSLLDLEQKVFVERLNDPRTHLARVNGAMSGPVFLQEAFKGATVDKKLEEITMSFLTDSTKNFYDAHRRIFFVSPLFLWFQEHFGRWEFSNRMFIQKRLQGLPANFRMEFMGFDWKLNDTRNR